MAFMVHTGYVVFAVARVELAGEVGFAGDSSARRRLPAWIEVIVMPWPKVGLKLTTASPNGMMPAGNRSILS